MNKYANSIGHTRSSTLPLITMQAKFLKPDVFIFDEEDNRFFFVDDIEIHNDVVCAISEKSLLDTEVLEYELDHDILIFDPNYKTDKN